MSQLVRICSFLFLAASFPFVAACHPDEHDHAEAAKPAEPKAPEFTLANLGERYLVHLIHPALVRGVRAEALLHGTRRDEGGPITGGQAVLVARGTDGAALRFPMSEHIPGHWPGEVEFPSSGRWLLAIDVQSAAGNEEIAIGAVEVYADAAAVSRAPAPEPPAGAIPFLFEQQWPVAMKFERVAPRPLTEWLTVSGRIAPRPGAEAHVAAPLSGRLLPPAGGRLPRPGDRVAAGDVIAFVEPYLAVSDAVGLQSLEYQQHQLRHELDLQQLAADRALGAAKVRIHAGTREAERTVRLVAQTLATQQELDRARAEVDFAIAEEIAALASIDAVKRLRDEHGEDPRVKPVRMEITAPIGGVIAEVDAVLGEAVEAGLRIATILDLESVWAIAEIPESELGRLGSIFGARLRPLGSETALDLMSAPVRVAPRVDPETRCVEVAFVVSNAEERLRAGMLAAFELRLRAIPEALSVPASALMYEQGQPAVFVLVDGESVVKRRLRLGLRDGARLEVLEGLVAGDMLVATRADEVRLAALSGSGRIVEHQH